MSSKPYESVSLARSFNHAFKSDALAASGVMLAAPNVSSLSPSSAIAGGSGFTLSVNGTGFVDGFVIRIDGNDRSTTFVDSTELTTAIAASDIATAGSFSVTVFDPDPDLGGESAPLTFAINNPAPTTSSLSPSSKIVGDAAFTLTVSGNNFVDGATVDFGGTTHNATVLDATELTAQISAAEIDTVGTISVTVTNPTPGGGTSSPRTFTVNNPAPTLSSISPSSKAAGDAAFTLTVTGTDFVSGAIVRFNGSDRTTSFVDSTQVTAQITAADVAAGGTFPITVLNPSPGGGTSNAVDLTVTNPSPTLSSINPTTRTAGTAAFTLTATGTNFNSSSVVRFNGSNRTTTFVSSTQVTAQIAAADIATGGTFAITVLNPTPGGGTSSAVNLAVSNPSPTLSSINPTSKSAGSAAFPLTATGTNFTSSSVVRFNGSNRTTTFVSSTQLTAQITAADVAAGGSFPLTVFNPTPGGGTSTSRTLSVTNPVPTLSSINPTSRTAASGAFTITATGTNFNSSSVVRFNGSDRTTTFVSSTQLTAQITAADIATGGSYPITVFNPTPSGGTSTSRTLTVNNPVPTLSSINPSTKGAGDAAFTLTATGSNFVGSSVVRFNGSDRTTTFVSGTQLTAQITATDVAANGTFPIRVFNPTPSGGQSGTVNLTVNNPVPIISSLSPSSATVGGAGFTLTVNGTKFLTGSVVRFNGSNRTTTFVSSTQVTALLTATDIANAGAFPITVSNPTPGGGVSNSVNLEITLSLTSISPTTVRAGGLGLALTVNGTGFVAGAVVRFNGSSRSTTFINSTTLTASIPATDISSVGNFPITVLNPNGVPYSAINLAVIPSLNNLTPLLTTAGNPAFTLTIQGAGFVNGSVVQWNGINRTTTFVSSIKLTASISAADVAVPGSVPVSVLNPPPNSLSSNAVNFIVSDPPPATECPIGDDVTLANPGLVNSGPARAQLWRTDDNIWWGAFSNNTDGIYFYKRNNPTTWTQGNLIDTNMVAGVFMAGAPDCLWTGTNLFILIQESQTLAKLYKYTYNSAAQTYAVVSGFPVNIPLTGIGTSGGGKVYGTLAIEQDGTGRLWASYTGGGIGGDGNMKVIWSTSADHTTWNSTGFLLATGLSTLKTEGAAIVRFGGNKIGVAWSNLNASENAFRSHNDADSPTTWSAKQVIDSGLGPEGIGSVSGKQMSMKAHPDGRIFMVSDDNDGINNHLHLYIRTAAGVWGNKTLVLNSFAAMPSKPVLLLDTDNSIVHVLYKNGALTSNGLTGQTFITQALMINPAFNTPCIFIDTSDNEGTTGTSNPTSTKQTINASTDLVAAASTGRQGNRILTNTVDITPNVLTIFSLSPKEVTAGENTSAVVLTVNGKLFLPGAMVRLNGSNRTTTFFNAGKLTAMLTIADTAVAGTYPITVLNPGGGVSNTVNLVVTAQHPVPTVGLISPNREAVGSPPFIMTVHGAGFRRSSVVRFNGSNRTTTFISDAELTATIPASDVLVPGPYPITVFNPTPGGGISIPTTVTTFYVEPGCAPPLGQNIPGITLFNTVKSQMWYNDGLWWGAFSDNLGGIYFHKQSGNTFIKGALLDGNFNGRPDVLWNGTNLFVMVYEFNTLAKLYKYSYNTITDTYTLISGFPIDLPLTGIGPGVSAAEIGSITIAEDSTGKLWAAYPGTFIGGDGNYRVIWSTSADQKTWNSTGMIFDSGGSVNTQEVAPIIHFGGNKVGIVYSKQPTQEIKFRYHVDGDPETTWSGADIVDSGLGHVGVGGVADNHMSLRAAPDGRLFVVAKDSDAPFGYINLYTRSAAGVWSNPVLVDIDPHAADTRPSLVLDLENSEAYVFYSDATSNFMYINKANMTNPVFGPACPYVSHPAVWDSTSTRQNVKASMGLWAVGSTGGVTSAIYFNPVTLTAGSGNVPALNSVSPSSVGADRGPFTLTVNGSNFATSAVVYINGFDRATTFVSSTQLTVRLMASDVQALGTRPVTVMNPKGGTSATVNLTVNPAPTLNSLTPSTAIAGGAAFTLTVSGAGFVNGAVVRFNDVNRTTTFVSATQLSAQILATDIASGGSKAVTVVNPDGGTSAPSNFTVNNPLPTGTTLSPSSVIVGGSAFTLLVNGSNFNSSSVVNFNGVARATSLVNSTQLTAQIQAADIATIGTFPVTVFNPAPGGGTSNTTNLPVVNPVPAITALSPPSAIAGAGGFTLSVNGTGFVNSSVVRFNGSGRTTTFVSATELTAQITAADVAGAGTFPITAFNPTPGGGSSNAVGLTVNNPAPTLVSINPTSKTAGGATFTLAVNGANYNSSSTIKFNGGNRATTFVSGTQLTAQIAATDVAAAGTFSITVFNPAPGGGTSSATNLTVNNPAPTTSSISPLSKTAGDASFILTVNGSNYNSSSIVRFNGSDRTTTFVSSTQLTAQITAVDVATAGTFAITVFNPAPGGGTSSATDLTVNNPAPTVSNISPTSRTAGDAAFILTVNGANLSGSSIVRFNGSNRSTTFVNTTQLTVQITAVDVAAAGTFSITIFNPAPGGGTSNAVDFSVNNPVPAVGTLAPNAIVEGSIGLTLAVNGTAFASGSVVQWNGQSRTTSFVSPTQLTAQITAADIATVGTANVTVFNPAPGGGTSNAVTFSIDPNTRVAQVVNSSGSANSTVTVPIQLASQGDENVLSFSLNFDTTLLSNPQATVGNDAAEATLNTNITQVAQGHYGIALSLPNGQSFAAGTRQIVNMTFTTAVVTTQTASQISFGDQPTARQALSSSADTLPVVFTAGTATITLGYEADVSPRPNGSNNGTISIADWVQMGRFSSGIEIPEPGSEFQRADCAPTSTLGNGSISISDWVQAGRYASGIEPVLPAGGPTGAASAPQMQAGRVTTDRAKGDESDKLGSTKVDLVSTILPAGQNSAASIEFDAQGNENAFGFSLMFDPAKVRFVSAEKSSEASAATLNINKLEATKGRVGIALALPAGRAFAVGKHQLVVLNFTLVGETSELPSIGFTDQPISRELVDLNANRMPAVFQNSLGVNPTDDTQFFVQQHYLDFLNRTADSGGLDYWIQQISECGRDLACVGQRRIAVSAAFFMEQEFQQTGGAVYRLYKAAYGRRPTYAEFLSDRSRLIAGEQLPASTREFAHHFVAGGEFKAAYPDSLSAVEFINKLYESAGLSRYASEKQQALEEMRTKGKSRAKSRAQVLLELIENKAFREREYNAAFVLMQYFGYLRRDPDQGGYDFWLNVLNLSEPGNYRGMVCSFITSREYQERFSKVVTRTNQDCGP